MVAVWPFVGRREELRFIRAALLDKSGLVLSGAAGTGKSALMSQALAQLPGTEYVTQWVTATRDSAAVPFGAIAPLLPAGLPVAASRLGLLRMAAQTMTADLAGRRLVIGVDDAHLLDDLSAALVQHLVQLAAAAVVLAVRTGEPGPDAVTALWKDEMLDRLDLPPLTEPQIDELLTVALGGQVETGTVRRMHRMSGGNVLLVRELVRAALDAGTLTEIAGVWRWRSGPVLAPRLVGLIAERLGQLDADERDVLELVAFGDPIGLDMVAGLVRAAALDSVAGKDLVRIAQDHRHTQVHLAHPLYAEVLRAQCPPSRANRWRRALADAVESAGAGRLGDWTRVATWRLDTSGTCESRVLLRAAREAAAAMDMALAERFAVALAHAGDEPAAADVLWRVVSLRDPTRTEDMDAMLARLLADPDLTDEQRARLAHDRAFLQFWFLDRTEDAIAVLRLARSDLQDSGWRAELTALEGLFHVYRPDPRAALNLVRPMASRASLSRRVQAQADVATGIAQALLGRLAEAQEALAAAAAAITAEPVIGVEIPGLDLAAEVFAVIGLQLSGQIIEATRRATGLREQALVHDWHWSTALLCATEAQAWRFYGRIARARRILREGLSHYRSDPGGGAAFGAPLLAEVATVAALTGKGQVARDALAEAERAFRPSQAVFRFAVDLARPWVAFASGQRSAAVELAEQAAASAREVGAYGFEQLALYDLVRFDAADRAADRLSELTGVVQGELVELLARHATAAGDGTALDGVAAGLAAADAELFAAEAAVSAAKAHRDAGQQAAANRSAGVATRLVTRCEGAVVPGLAELCIPRLSGREQMVAELAAAGLSNRAIAEKLVLSARTVENHLHRVYTKLGVHGRADLARWVRE